MRGVSDEFAITKVVLATKQFGNPWSRWVIEIKSNYKMLLCILT
jgi:hypothetical protein